MFTVSSVVSREMNLLSFLVHCEPNFAPYCFQSASLHFLDNYSTVWAICEEENMKLLVTFDIRPAPVRIHLRINSIIFTFLMAVCAKMFCIRRAFREPRRRLFAFSFWTFGTENKWAQPRQICWMPKKRSVKAIVREKRDDGGEFDKSSHYLIYDFSSWIHPIPLFKVEVKFQKSFLLLLHFHWREKEIIEDHTLSIWAFCELMRRIVRQALSHYKLSSSLPLTYAYKVTSEYFRPPKFLAGLSRALNRLIRCSFLLIYTMNKVLYIISPFHYHRRPEKWHLP